MTQRRLYIAAYDIASPKRLRQALRIARNYATGGQKSVFECYLTPAEKRELMQAMIDLIDPVVDRFLLVPVDARGKVHVLGIAVAPSDPAFFYVG